MATSNINLSRNTKVYFTTNVNTSGIIADADFTTSNTYQIQVLDGFSFNQGTSQSTIQISEAGNNPSRGQRAFNTSLNPVDFSFSTYIRPVLTTGTAGPVTSAEKVLWNALFGEVSLDAAGVGVTSLTRIAQVTGTGTAATTSSTASPQATLVLSAAITKRVNTTSTTGVAVSKGDIINITGADIDAFNRPVKIISDVAATDTAIYTVEYFMAPVTTSTVTVTSAKAYAGQWAQGNTSTTAALNSSYVSTMGANKNQLQKFGMLFVVDNVTYAVDNCAMDQASIAFGLDTIATCAWTGKGTSLRTSTASITASTANVKAAYITNKLSTMVLNSNIGGDLYTTTASKPYTIPITGGTITISNNITYQTPTNLAVVNVPIGYYTGQRAISGNVTAYLRTGDDSTNSGSLLTTLLANVTGTEGVEPKYYVKLEMGGVGSANRVDFEMPAVVLQIPAVNIADVVATTINFSAQGFNPDVKGQQLFDITKSNELLIRYYSNTSST
jgi:hypothetical protein